MTFRLVWLNAIIYYSDFPPAIRSPDCAANFPVLIFFPICYLDLTVSWNNGSHSKSKAVSPFASTQLKAYLFIFPFFNWTTEAHSKSTKVGRKTQDLLSLTPNLFCKTAVLKFRVTFSALQRRGAITCAYISTHNVFSIWVLI